MASIGLILKLHEPYRLRHYSFFDIGESPFYSDDTDTLAHLNRMAESCYLPVTRLLLEQVEEYRGDFKFALSLSGVTLSQFERFEPKLLDAFKRLADTGCVEFICEPYFHSLANLFSRPEYREQVEMHREKIHALFGKRPLTLYACPAGLTDDLARDAESTGFQTLLTPASAGILDSRSPHRVYQPASCSSACKLVFETPLFSADTLLTDPAAGPRFTQYLLQQPGEVIFLAARMTAFQETPAHSESGAMDFLAQFPGRWLESGSSQFYTPTSVTSTFQPCASLSLPGYTAREDAAEAAQDWTGNEMQKDAINGLYLLEQEVKASPDQGILLLWRYLQDADHFLFMKTKPSRIAPNQASPSPYNSAYDAYINFMNILTDFSERLALSPDRGH